MLSNLIKTGNKKAEYTININDPDKLHSFSLGTFCEDRKGHIWVGYWSGEIDVINPKTHKIRHFESQSAGRDYFPANSIRQIVADSNGNLWITSATHGIIEYLIDQDKFIYRSVDCEPDFESNGFYRTIYIDRNESGLGRQVSRAACSSSIAKHASSTVSGIILLIKIR